MLTDPVPIIAPAYLLGGGALFGVILTLTVQVIQSFIQRRMDRQGRAFNVRMEVYSGILLADDELRQIRAIYSAVEARNDVVAIKSAGDEAVAAIGKVTEIKRSLAAVPDSAEEAQRRRTILAGELKAAQVAKDAAMARSDKASKAGAKAREELDMLDKRVEDARTSMAAIFAKLQIVGNREVLEAATKIIGRYHKDDMPTADEMLAYRKAARREIGLR